MVEKSLNFEKDHSFNAKLLLDGLSLGSSSHPDQNTDEGEEMKYGTTTW